MTSNGNSTRESGQIQLRRRLHSGLTASAQYTYSKSIDDALLGGRGQGTAVVAQNWLDLSAERAPFELRPAPSVQRTDTVHHRHGIGRGSVARRMARRHIQGVDDIDSDHGWERLALDTHLSYGGPWYGRDGEYPPGLYGRRSSFTRAAPAAFPTLNPAAYVCAWHTGEWGNAGRNSITGPGQLAVNLSLGRTFRWRDRFHIDLRFDSLNALNQRYVHELEHHCDQCPVRATCLGQRHAHRASYSAPEVLTHAIPTRSDGVVMHAGRTGCHVSHRNPACGGDGHCKGQERQAGGWADGERFPGHGR